MTTTSSVAVRNDGALAIQPDQPAWTPVQKAAFGQIGIADAPDGDKAVFLHVSQRTGLDPFARQIYMIGRNEKKNEKRGDRWVETWSVKWTIQTGIEGWRVIRDRAERREGVRGILSRFTYYDPEGTEHKVWVRREPPVACEVTYTVRARNGTETPYTSVLRMDEYMQTRDDKDGNRVPVAQWAVKDVHMLEKCTEADVYRKAFPQDFSGVYLDDAMPPADPDAPPVTQQVRQQVTAEQIRQRRSTVTAVAETVTPNVPAAETAPSPTSGQRSAEGTAAAGDEERPRLIASGQLSQLQAHRERLGYTDTEQDWEQWLQDLATLAGLEALASPGELTQPEAAKVISQLKPLKNGDELRFLLRDGVKAGGAADGGTRDAD